MPNTFVFPTWVSMEPLRQLLNRLEIASIFTSNWNSEFKREFAVGETITVKKPNRVNVTDGLGLVTSPMAPQTTTISLNQPFHIGLEWDDFEKVMYMERPDDQIRRLYLEPVAQKLYQEVESRAALFAYQNTPNVFGILGTNPVLPTPFLNAADRLHDKSAPTDERKMIISSRMMTSFLVPQPVQFNPAPEITQQYKKGVVGTAHGWEWYRSNSLYRHTAGTWAAAVTVNLAGQSGSNLNVNCTNGDTFLKGDVFSILNVNFVNPNTLRVPAGNQVQHYVLTQDVTAAGATASLPIYPPIIGPGTAFQNVDALPANLAALTSWPGTAGPNGLSGTQGLALAPNAFAIVGASYERPPNVQCSFTRDPETGLAIRFTRQWDIQTAKTYSRWDMCIGFGVLYADECAARVVGA